jgi:transposase
MQMYLQDLCASAGRRMQASEFVPAGGHRRSRIAHEEAVIRGWKEATLDLTLAELSDPLAAEGIEIKVPTLSHQLNKWGLSYKKPARQRAVARGRAAGKDEVEARSAAMESRSVGFLR